MDLDILLHLLYIVYIFCRCSATQVLSRQGIFVRDPVLAAWFEPATEVLNVVTAAPQLGIGICFPLCGYLTCFLHAQWALDT